jgi:hypothetical protein
MNGGEGLLLKINSTYYIIPQIEELKIIYVLR